MLKQKTVAECVYKADGSGRCTKKLLPDEIDYLKENKGLYGWKALNREINLYRPMYCKVSLGHMMQQANRLGIFDKTIATDVKTTPKKVVASKYFNPHQFKIQ